MRYDIKRPGKVSIIVPTRDHGADVDLCFRSLFERSTYTNIEIILLDNGSRDPDSLKTFGRWLQLEPERIKLVHHDVPFNFSAINNFAATHATGEYLLFLNNDTEIITDDWIEAMIEQAQRPAIGAVGAKLLYGDNTVQHAGVIVGLGGVAGHSHKYFGADEPGYFYTLQTVNNFSAVTGACCMIRREVFEEVGGFDEGLAIAFNDVDLCLRIKDAGYRNIYLPHVVLYHHESKSRGHEDTPEKQARFLREQQVIHERWKSDTVPDPYYNINLVLRCRKLRDRDLADGGEKRRDKRGSDGRAGRSTNHLANASCDSASERHAGAPHARRAALRCQAQSAAHVRSAGARPEAANGFTRCLAARRTRRKARHHRPEW